MSACKFRSSFDQRFGSMVDESLNARSAEITLDLAARSGDRFNVILSHTLSYRYSLSATELEDVLRGDDFAWAEWPELFQDNLSPLLADICRNTRHGCIRLSFPAQGADGLVRVVGGTSYQCNLSVNFGRCVP